MENLVLEICVEEDPTKSQFGDGGLVFVGLLVVVLGGLEQL